MSTARSIYRAKRMDKIKLYLRIYPDPVTDSLIARVCRDNGINPTESVIAGLRPPAPDPVPEPKPKRRRKGTRPPVSAPKVTEEKDG